MDVADRVQPKALRDTLGHDAEQLRLDIFRSVGGHHVTIGLAGFRGERHLTPMNAMRVDNVELVHITDQQHRRVMRDDGPLDSLAAYDLIGINTLKLITPLPTL